MNNDSYKCDSREKVSAVGVLLVVALWLTIAIMGFPKATGLLVTLIILAIFLPLSLCANKIFKQKS